MNPDIEHMAFLRGYIENIGRGTLKIMDSCKTAGLKAPNWTTSESSVQLPFFLIQNLSVLLSEQQRLPDKNFVCFWQP